MTRERERRPRGAGLAILLILAGVLILLANLGWFDWLTLLRLGSLWPVLLVAIGADMLTRGRYRVVVWGAAIVVGALLYAYDGGGPRAVLGGGPGESHSISQPLSGARSADVTLTTSVGELQLSGGAASGELASGTIRTGRGETLLNELSRRGDTAVLRLVSQQRPGFGIGANERRRWEVQLSPRVPIALTIKTGVGQANLDLRNLDLTSLRMEEGVGEVRATLPGSGSYRASFKAGVGATHITIPRSIAARVTVQAGLGSVQVNGTFSRSGDVYQTPDYQAATDRMELDVEGGLGRITIDR